MVKGIGNMASLVLRLSQRDFSAKYKGSMIGLIWSVLTPLAMLTVYTFIFTYVFKTTWVGMNGTSEYALNIFVGLIFHLQLIETFGGASMSVVANPNYVKKVVFPIGILPLVKVIAILVHTFISVFILFIFYFFISDYFSIVSMIEFLPVVLVHALMCMGIAWIIAAVGVYFRDIAHALSLLSMLLLFMSPIFYSIEMVPEKFRWLMALNPNTFFINMGRDVLLQGNSPSYLALLFLILITLAFSFASYKFFGFLKKGFADVL